MVTTNHSLNFCYSDLWFDESSLIKYEELLHILEQTAGRIIINGFPTGVEVCNSMVNEGPFLPTTYSRTTSVGTAAIFRFVKPVCYQKMPQSLLPEELTNMNPLKIYRLADGMRTKEAVTKVTNDFSKFMIYD